MTRSPIRIGMFTLPEPMHGGQWAWPGNQSERLYDPAYWSEIAEILEHGKADFFFFGDSYGYTWLNGERPRVSSTDSLDLPRFSPDIMIGALSQHTKHLAFVETASTTFEPPYSHAKRIGTLDHVTGGRFGWNIVTTSWAESSAQSFGVPLVGHDDRYLVAEDHLQIVYRLLEESWEEDALVLDRERRVFADPDKIHNIDYQGEYYRSFGPGNIAPSPQRLPVLFQAGSSSAGVAFGAKWAEVAFIVGSTDAAARKIIQNYKDAAIAAGRSPENLRFMTGLSVVLGDTTADAQRKHAELVTMNSYEATVASYANFTGLDLSSYAPETPATQLRGLGQMFTHIERYIHVNPDATVGDIIDGHRVTMGARSFHAIGTVEEVVDRIEQLADEVGFHGILIEPYVLPEDARDLADKIIPELRRRGRFRHEYEEDTLRERLFGHGQARVYDDYHAGKRTSQFGG